MKKLWFLHIGVMIVMAGVWGTDAADAAELKVDGRFAGSVITSSLDLDGNGIPGTLTVAQGKTSLGPVSIQATGENAPQLPIPTSCPHNNLEFPVLAGQVIYHFEESGALLFGKSVSGSTCYDPTTGIFVTKWKGTFSGGTGRFSNATGAFDATSTGKTLVRDRTGHEFDYLTGEFSGMIVTP